MMMSECLDNIVMTQMTFDSSKQCSVMSTCLKQRLPMKE